MIGMTTEPKEESVVAMLNQPFFQVALPLMFTVLIAVWVNNHGINKGFDGMNRGFDGVNRRIDDVVSRLGRVADRLVSIESRLGAVERKVDALEVKAWR